MHNFVGLITLFFTTVAQALPVAPLRGDVVDSEPAPAVYRSTDHAQVTRVFDENVGIETSTKPLPDASGINVTPDVADKYGADFDNVIVVNKAPDASGLQWMTVYRYAQLENGHRKLLETHKFKVSTGREVWRCESKLDKNRQPTGELEARWLGTPTGFYVPFSCEAMHTSNTYDDAKMRNACFFNHLGIAIHKPDVSEMPPAPETTGDDAKDAAAQKAYADRQSRYDRAVASQLRARMSHGCVRTEEADQIQQWIIESGATPDGSFMQGYTARLKDVLNKPNLSKRERAEFEQKLKDSLKLVDDATPNGERDGVGPYTEQTMVPDLNVSTGKPKHGDDGQIKMVKAPRSLVVVECRTPSGRDCSTTQADLNQGRAALDCNPGSKADPVPQTVDPLSAFFGKLFGG